MKSETRVQRMVLVTALPWFADSCREGEGGGEREKERERERDLTSLITRALIPSWGLHPHDLILITS